ncbi:MAG: hypothetical protein WCV92_03105 [Candidatus Buchananbacteria bacterium]
MRKKLIISFVVLIVILLACLVFIYFKNNNKSNNFNNPQLSTITGEYRGTKGGGIVDGVYIPYSELKSSDKYIGKTIELRGHLKDYPCPKNVTAQCFNGPMLTNIQSIREIND